MVSLGLEGFFRNFKESARVGLVTNASACDRNGAHIVDRILETPNLQLSVIFSPEHGFGANEPDGEPVSDSLHPRLKIPITSLYGEKKVPSAADLRDLDILVYDIQDVGVRFYTYISTLKNILEAASSANKPVHILDRPDILGGSEVEGPVFEEGFSSFVGHVPVPLRYGLTPGELGLWWKKKAGLNLELKVWECRGWSRGMTWEEWHVPWVNLSPSMISPQTARFYPGTCLFEGTNISEGRGTSAPFQIFGAPWVNAEKWEKFLKESLPTKINVEKVSFSPTFSKFEGQRCFGIKVDSSENRIDDPVLIGLILLETVLQCHFEEIEFSPRGEMKRPFFDYLAGNAWLREGLLDRLSAQTLYRRGQEELGPFLNERNEILIYQPLYPSGIKNCKR